MTAKRPPLLPLLRSENQVRLLSALLLAPQRRFTVSELAETTGVPQPSVSREVANLLVAGLVVADVERGRRVVAANVESPIYPELASILRKTVGPKPVLEALLEDVSGIERAAIYGSWARRYAGEPGPEPGDVDLLVVGAVDVTRIRRRAERASRDLGRDVNVTVLTPAEWRASASGLLRQLKAAPLVDLDLGSVGRTAV